VLDRVAFLGQPLAQALEEHVAARLGDVENADLQAVELFGPGEARLVGRAPLGCGIQQDAHDFTSLVTGELPRRPLEAQPGRIIENMPAVPPARTSMMPPWRNLLTVVPGLWAPLPSAMPFAPGIRSSAGICVSL